MILFRFLQGIGTGGEVPVASAYINEYIGAKQRGRFFLLYEVMFLVGLVRRAYRLALGAELRLEGDVHRRPRAFDDHDSAALFMSESPRWLAAKGRYDEADEIVSRLEKSVVAVAGH